MTDELKQYIKQRRIPEKIALKTRYGKNETNLVLYDATVNSDTRVAMFIYKIEAMFPYTVHGQKNNINAVDFSEGPMIALGYVIKGLEVASIKNGTITMTQVS